MTKLVRDAIQAMQDLPDERRDMLARAILNYAARDNDEIHRLSDDEREAIEEGLASPVVPDEELKLFRNRHGA
jgi:alpha-ketoglutarate-dependent taurine dioxygenase